MLLLAVDAGFVKLGCLRITESEKQKVYFKLLGDISVGDACMLFSLMLLYRRDINRFPGKLYVSHFKYRKTPKSCLAQIEFCLC